MTNTAHSATSAQYGIRHNAVLAARDEAVDAGTGLLILSLKLLLCDWLDLDSTELLTAGLAARDLQPYAAVYPTIAAPKSTQ